MLVMPYIPSEGRQTHSAEYIKKQTAPDKTCRNTTLWHTDTKERGRQAKSCTTDTYKELYDKELNDK